MIVYISDLNIEHYLLDDAKIEKKYTGVEVVTSDLNKGDLLGQYEIYSDDVLIYSKDIYLEKNIINYSIIIYVIGLIIIVSAFAIRLKKKKKSKN